MPDLQQTFDEIAQNAQRSTLAPSLSIAAVKGGEIVFQRAFGAAHVDTVYNIASVTKQFTAACILLLQREGLLSLEDRVAQWFPELTRADDITIRNLLSHTSGYPDYYPLGFADEEKLHETPPAEIVRRYATLPLQFEPGSMWSYSNTGYHIAGLIVERVTGKPFGEVLMERVLRPAGMLSSFFNDPPAVTAKHASAYTRYCLGPQREAPGERAGWIFSSGGIASTAADLARWHTGLMRNVVLSPDETAEMTTAFTFTSGEPSDTALGWFVEDRGGHPVIQHSGGVAGFSSQTIVSLKERCSVVVLANGDHVPTGAIASRLFEALLPGAHPPALPPVEDAERAQEAARKWLAALSSGGVDGLDIQPELQAYLNESRLSDAREGLHGAGAAGELKALASGERGGMSWHRVRVKFAARDADIVLRQTESGALAEFNVYPVP